MPFILKETKFKANDIIIADKFMGFVREKYWDNKENCFYYKIESAYQKVSDVKSKIVDDRFYKIGTIQN